MYLAPNEYDFCMILNCIFCIIYCCIYYVCNNLVALLKFVQYVRIKKYLFIENVSMTGQLILNIKLTVNINSHDIVKYLVMIHDK